MYKIPAKTLFLGKNLVFVPECHSTNTLLAEMSQKSNLTEGTLVITNHQTAGRGQRGNTWVAAQGMNLTFSLLMRPPLKPHQQFVLTQAISLGICDYVQQTVQADVHIKWPNDILFHQKKLCGILIENALSGHRIQNSIVGIGLNINQDLFLIPTATSLSLATGKAYDLNEELHTLLSFLEVRYMQLKNDNLAQLQSDYLKCLLGKGEKRTYRNKEGAFEGTIEGVDEAGRLVMLTNDGMKFYQLKEIEFMLS